MRYASALLTAVVLGTGAPSAPAEPPVSGNGHTHHVSTGDGGCVDIDAVRFRVEDRGLHQGADASGSGHGPWHGGC